MNKESENKICLSFDINGKDFSIAGEASSEIKKILKQIGIKPEIIRKVAIAMYEGEINMVIHANGGKADIEITPSEIMIKLQDEGPGIPDIELAMKEGYSTATDSVRELGFGAGMGLPNIKKYTDKLDISSKVGKGTKLTMFIKIK